MSDGPSALKRVLPRSILSTYGVECEAYGQARYFANAADTNAWTTANLAMYIPFVLDAPFLVSEIAWVNGATLNGNIEVAWYDGRMSAKLVTTGSTAQAGTSTLQAVDVSDTWLPRGLVFLGVSTNSATATYRMQTMNARSAQHAGIRQEASAFALPSTPTPVQASTISMFPLIRSASRAGF